MKTLLTTLFIFIAGSLVFSQEKALNYKELQKFLPSEIMGYTASEDIDGSSFEMNGMSYSTAQQTYEKGDSYLNIMIMDYQGAAAMYSAAAMTWSSGMSFEDDDQKANSVSIDGYSGWLVYEKQDHVSELLVGVKDRYLIQVEVSEVNDGILAQDIIKKLKLSDLP
jgi:hypothetical protein